MTVISKLKEGLNWFSAAMWLDSLMQCSGTQPSADRQGSSFQQPKIIENELDLLQTLERCELRLKLIPLHREVCENVVITIPPLLESVRKTNL